MTTVKLSEGVEQLLSSNKIMMSQKAFVAEILECIDNIGLEEMEFDAPYKYAWIANFSDTKAWYMPIGSVVCFRCDYSGPLDNQPKEEFPLLTRYRKVDDTEIPKAMWLKVTLFSREFLKTQNIIIEEDYMVSNVTGELYRKIVPATPEAIIKLSMKTNLVIDEKKFEEAVEFWSKHVMVMQA